jgi:AraC-like DNA-binding protein
MNTETIARYLADHPVIDTHDAGEMEDALKSRWQAKSFTTRDSSKRFHSLGRFSALDRLTVSFGYYRAGALLDFNGVPTVRQHFVVGGAGVMNIQRKNFVLDPSNSCVIPPNVENAWEFGDRYQHITVRISQANIDSMLTNLIGVSPRGGMQFKLSPASGPHFEQLCRFALLLTDEVSRPETSMVFIRELEDAFLTQFLVANDHNHREALAAKSRSATPKQVQFVEDYIVANWDKPFTIEDVARLTDVSARTIYATFSQHRGYGPATFLRQVRLNKARELLQQGRYSISTVARMCAFPSAGRFARYYRAAFGELPSDTRR